MYLLFEKENDLVVRIIKDFSEKDFLSLNDKLLKFENKKIYIFFVDATNVPTKYINNIIQENNKNHTIIVGASEDIRNKILLKNQNVDFINESDDFEILKYKSFKEILEYRLNENKHGIAYVYKNKKYTWEDIEKSSQIVADDLAKIGVKKGTHIALCSKNSINWIITFFAIQKLGAIAVLLNFSLTSQGIKNLSILGDIEYFCYGELQNNEENFLELIKKGETKIKKVYCIDNTKDIKKRYDEYEIIKNKYKNKVEFDDPSMFIFTSGSTGNPKGVITSTYNLILSAYNLSGDYRFTKEDVFCLSLPLFHIFGFTGVFVASILTNSKLCICENVKTANILEIIEKYRCSIYYSVPSVIYYLIKNKDYESDKLVSLRYILCGGEQVSKKHINDFIKYIPYSKVGVGYGLSEIVPISLSLYNDKIEKVFNSVGKICDNISVKIEDINTRKEIKEEKEGEILVRANNMLISYYKLPIDKQPIDNEGYFYTGDLGYVDSDGYLVLSGRLKELIIRCGENINPNEVASVIMEEGDFANVKVIGEPDENYGEIVTCALVMKNNVKFDKIKLNEFLVKKLEKFKIPSYYFVYDDFPLLANGKVDGVNLKKDIYNKLNKV